MTVAAIVFHSSTLHLDDAFDAYVGRGCAGAVGADGGTAVAGVGDGGRAGAVPVDNGSVGGTAVVVVMSAVVSVGTRVFGGGDDGGDESEGGD